MLCTRVWHHLAVNLPAFIFVFGQERTISGRTSILKKEKKKKKKVMKRFKRFLRSLQQKDKGAETGKWDSLGPCVHTLGAQPVISLSWEANMAFPARTLEPGTGHTIGCVVGIWPLSISLFSMLGDFPIDFHSGESFKLSRSSPLFWEQITARNYVSSAHEGEKHLTGLMRVVSRHVMWMNLDTWKGVRHWTLLHQPFNSTIYQLRDVCLSKYRRKLSDLGTEAVCTSACRSTRNINII